MLFILRTPNIIRVFLPVTLFLYVRKMLDPTLSISGWQYLHLLFPVLITIGIMPDLFLSAAEKSAILDHYYQHNQYFISKPMGWIPAGFVQPVSILVGILYGVISLWTIQKTMQKRGSNYIYLNKQSLTWLNLLSGAITVYFYFSCINM